MNRPRLVIFGNGGAAKDVVRVGRLTAETYDEQGLELVLAVDVPGPDVMGIKVIPTDEIRHQDKVVIAVGDPVARANIAKRYLSWSFTTLVAPTVVCGPHTSFGEGSVLLDYSVITANVVIGRHFHCNIFSYVAHDCRIGDFVTFGPRASCNGNVHIFDGAYVGSGAIIRQGTPDKPLIIGEGATIGMGAVVTRDVSPGTTVVGNPARVMSR